MLGRERFGCGLPCQPNRQLPSAPPSVGDFRPLSEPVQIAAIRSRATARALLGLACRGSSPGWVRRAVLWLGRPSASFPAEYLLLRSLHPANASSEFRA